jgi:hypothetical protein
MRPSPSSSPLTSTSAAAHSHARRRAPLPRSGARLAGAGRTRIRPHCYAAAEGAHVDLGPDAAAELTRVLEADALSSVTATLTARLCWSTCSPSPPDRL